MDINAENLVNTMMASRENFERIKLFIETVMKKKELEERESGKTR